MGRRPVWQHQGVGEEELLVAEQVVSVPDKRSLKVRISQHSRGEFWRVDVAQPGSDRNPLTTTVAPGDSFMMNLISEAVGGQQLAWDHLARWAQPKF